MTFQTFQKIYFLPKKQLILYSPHCRCVGSVVWSCRGMFALLYKLCDYSSSSHQPAASLRRKEVPLLLLPTTHYIVLHGRHVLNQCGLRCPVLDMSHQLNSVFTYLSHRRVALRIYAKQTVPYNPCVGTPISCLLTNMFRRLFSIVFYFKSVLNMKAQQVGTFNT